MKISKIALSVTATVMSLSLLSCTHTKREKTEETSNNTKETANGVRLHTIYFDFDRSDIRADQRDNAEDMANSLKDHPNVRVKIEGNTDDRGSTEYNMALGTRRATALKKYLVQSGVSSEKVETVSYGKERPTV